MKRAAAGFCVTGGTLRHDAPCDVERQADVDLYDSLSRGEYCYVLTARQMRKSSLMVRAATRFREEGAAVIALDLENALDRGWLKNAFRITRTDVPGLLHDLGEAQKRLRQVILSPRSVVKGKLTAEGRARIRRQQMSVTALAARIDQLEQ